MGCGSSKSSTIQQNDKVFTSKSEKIQLSRETTNSDGAVQSTRTSERVQPKHTTKATENHSQTFNANGYTTPKPQENKENVPRTQTPDNQPETTGTAKQRRHSSSAVAFEVNFDENSNLRGQRRPPKLQKLDHAPVLTAEMLVKKQALAEENRQKEIQKKISKTSKRKKQLREARELDMAAETKRSEIEEKMNAQYRKRAQAQAQIIEKQRRRELKAKRVRERAQRIKEGGDEADFEVDPDETYNADEENESWDDIHKKAAEEHDENSPMEHDENSTSRTTLTYQKQSLPNIETSEQLLHDTNTVHDFFEE